MRIRCGTDLLSDAHWKEHVQNKGFMDTVFTASEQMVKFRAQLKSIYAIKEACFKALSILPEWKKMNVSYDDSGKPVIELDERIKPDDMASIDCSVTHDRGMTQAIVVILLD